MTRKQDKEEIKSRNRSEFQFRSEGQNRLSRTNICQTEFHSLLSSLGPATEKGQIPKAVFVHGTVRLERLRKDRRPGRVELLKITNRETEDSKVH